MGKFIGTTGLLYLWEKIKSIIPTKVSDLTNDSGFTSNVGTITGITMNGASKGTSGVVNLGTVITSHQDISGKLDKTTFEWNKQLSNGSKGKVCLGKFFMYDSNVTIELSLTTLETYNATIVIASQNLNRTSGIGSIRVNVYGDVNNSITPLLSIFRPNPSTDNGSVEVYANLPGWSKCLVHVQGINLETKTEGGEQYNGGYDILSKVDTIPSEISGKTELTNDGTAGNNKVCNILKAYYYSKVYNGTSSQFLKADGSVDSNTYLTSYTETDPTVPSWAKQSTKPSYTAAEVGALPDSTTIPSASTATPQMDGSGAAGSASTYAKGDHVHPTDTTREARVTTVSHGTNDTTFALTPNVLHTWGTVNSLTLSLASGSSTYVDGYWFKFTAGSSFTALTMPSGINWVTEPEIEAGKTYEVMIVDGLASYVTSSIGDSIKAKTRIVNHGTTDTTYTLTPNTLHIWGEVASLNLSLQAESNGYVSGYWFRFTCGSTPTTLTLPSSVTWYYETVEFEANHTYEVTIVEGKACYTDYASTTHIATKQWVEDYVAEHSGSSGGNVSSTTVNTIVSLTEAEYTALSTKDSSTLYIITSS